MHRYQATLWLWRILGFSIPLGVRTTLVQYQIQGVDNVFLVQYLYGVDILIFILLLGVVRPWQYGIGYWIRWVVGLGCVIGLVSSQTLYPWLSWIALIRVMALIFIGQYVYVHRVLPPILQGFIVGMLMQFMISIGQMSIQQDLGFQVLGEPRLGWTLSNVAKAIVGPWTIIRSSGTFPHPNILGFAGLIGVWIWMMGRRCVSIRFVQLLVMIQMILVMQIDHYLITSVQGMLLGWLIVLVTLTTNKSQSMEILSPKWMIWPWFSLIVLSGSKTAILLMFLTFGMVLTWRFVRSMFHVEHFQIRRSISLLILGLIVGSQIFFLAISGLPTIAKRNSYIPYTWEMIQEAPFWGVGLGQFVASLPSKELELWQYQPVHNIFYLVWAELGTIGLSGLVVFVWWWMNSLIRIDEGK